jgi:pimeloyl-ACP methyl ester carboxylesterase
MAAAMRDNAWAVRKIAVEGEVSASRVRRAVVTGRGGPLLSAATCPIAMMWGDRSGLVDDEILTYMQDLLPPGSPQMAIPDADHHVMIDQPLAFVGALRGLLAGWRLEP